MAFGYTYRTYNKSFDLQYMCKLSLFNCLKQSNTANQYNVAGYLGGSQRDLLSSAPYLRENFFKESCAVTNIPINRSVLLPEPVDEKTEIGIRNLKNRIMQAYTEYKEVHFVDKANVHNDNLQTPLKVTSSLWKSMFLTIRLSLKTKWKSWN